MTPITLTLPWDVLVPDNRKYTVSRGRIILTTEYRHAKQWIYEIALADRAQKRWRPIDGRIALHAVVYEPDASRVRDVCNFAKLVQDGLACECYEDDGQIDDARWIRGGIDRNNPRMEITLTPLSPIPGATDEQP